MKKAGEQHLDFEIDKLTNSILNAITGDSFDTNIIAFTKADLVLLKNKEWLFDWKKN